MKITQNQSPKMANKMRNIKETLNFEFKYKDNKFLVNRLFRKLENSSLNIPKDEKIIYINCDLYYSDEFIINIFLFFPLILYLVYIIMDLVLLRINSEFNVNIFLYMPFVLGLTYALLYFYEITRPFQLLIFTDKSVNFIKIKKNDLEHRYIRYEWIIHALFSKNQMSILYEKDDIVDWIIFNIQNLGHQVFWIFSRKYLYNNKGNGNINLIKLILFRYLEGDAQLKFERKIVKSKIDELKNKAINKKLKEYEKLLLEDYKRLNIYLENYESLKEKEIIDLDKFVVARGNTRIFSKVAPIASEQTDSLKSRQNIQDTKTNERETSRELKDYEKMYGGLTTISDKPKNIEKEVKSSERMLKISIMGLIIFIIITKYLEPSFNTIFYIVSIYGITVFIIFILSSSYFLLKYRGYINLDKTRVDVKKDHLLIFKSKTDIESFKIPFILDLRFDNKTTSSYLSIEEIDYRVLNIYGTTKKSGNNRDRFDRIFWNKYIFSGSMDKLHFFFIKFWQKYLEWFKNTYITEDNLFIIGNNRISLEDIADIYVSTDEFNQRLYRLIKKAIQNYVCDVKRSSYRFKKMRPYMKTVEVKENRLEINLPEEIKDAPPKIEIPDELIKAECGPDSEADKVWTKDLINWGLLYPLEFYKLYIPSGDKILYAYHHSKEYMLRRASYLILLIIFEFLLIYIPYKADIKGAITKIMITMLCALIFTISFLILFFFIEHIILEDYKFELIFTERGIYKISYFNFYFTDYKNIEKGLKQFGRSQQELRKLKLVFKYHVKNSSNMYESELSIKKIQLNNPIFAILTQKGITFERLS
ncbi:MAG: hypothetical protein ACTSVV_06320 [Promethearchaeota archaeon]